MPANAKREILRTRSGCWTCRSRRKKCDEARPHCQTCQGLGLTCEGYGVRLRWSGRRKPFVSFTHLSQCSKGRAAATRNVSVAASASSLWGDMRSQHDAILLRYLGRNVFNTLSGLEREVLYDFADWGFATLVAKTTPEPPDRFEDALSSCAQSKPLLLTTITYQMTLESKHSHHVDEYYGRSIAQCREALSDPKRVYEDEFTPYAGILLSTISMHRAMPWTIHLNGIAGIYQEEGFFDRYTEESRELAALIGVLELPTHVLGRQTRHLNLWHRYCQEMTGIEELTGLPCSLIHLFAAASEPDAEDRLLKWSKEPSDPITCKLWDAAHNAGIILVREFRRDQNLPINRDSQVIASAVYSIIAVLRDLEPKMKQEDAMVDWDNLLFPLAAAGSQPAHLTPDGRDFIVECINTLSQVSMSHLPYYSVIVTALKKLWSSDGATSLHQVARDMGLELALF